MRKLTAKPLTAEGFSRFGDVIEVSPENEQLSINYGRTVRHHALSEVQLSGSDDTAIMNIFSSQPAELPFKATVMERHPLGSQAFIPLSGHPYLVAVAPPGAFDISAVELFLASPKQGVNYHRGTWHHYSLALAEHSNFLVVDRSGPNDNCDEITLEEPLLFDVNEAAQ